MEFEERQFDGPYEVIQVNIENNGENLKGLLYYPPQSFKKPYPLVIYFHGFPQLFPLHEIAKNYKFVLDMGFSFLLFNFRGYRYSEGNISIKSQYSDAKKIIELTNQLAEKGIFDMSNINIIAHDFGAYIALILCSKKKGIKNLVLLNPLINIEKFVYNEKFKESLAYINRFLPGNIRGIKNIEKFIDMTKEELSKEDFRMDNILRNLKNINLKIIIGEEDKVTPLSDVDYIQKNTTILISIKIVKGSDHIFIDDEEIEEANREIERILKNNNGENSL